MNKQRTPSARKAYDLDKLQALLQYIGRLLPNDQERAAFDQCSRTPPPASLRLNALQAQTRHVRPHLLQRGQSVPWCSEGFALPESDASLGQTIEHAMGAYYVQAKAPMLAVEVLAPQPGERVLDLCAAPGGKATQIAARMQNSGLLLANELQRKRMPALVGNLERCGVANHVLTQAPGTMLARYFPNFFDRILVDAPCSGDGIVRKDQSMLTYWSPQDAQRLAQQQKGLLRAAYAMLRPGGTLVYSTCSLSLEENEEVLLGLLRRYREDVAILPIPEFEGATAAGCAGRPIPGRVRPLRPRLAPPPRHRRGFRRLSLQTRADAKPRRRPCLGCLGDRSCRRRGPVRYRRPVERHPALPPGPDIHPRQPPPVPAAGARPGYPRASALLRPQWHEGRPPPQRVLLPVPANRRPMGASHAGT